MRTVETSLACASDYVLESKLREKAGPAIPYRVARATPLPARVRLPGVKRHGADLTSGDSYLEATCDYKLGAPSSAFNSRLIIHSVVKLQPQRRAGLIERGNSAVVTTPDHC